METWISEGVAICLFRKAIERYQVAGEFLRLQGGRWDRADRVPAVADGGRAPDGGTALAANPNGRVRLLDRLRQELDPRELHVLAVEFRIRTGPEFLVGAQVFVSDGAALSERRRGQRFEFLLHPADADAQYEPSLGQDIQRRQNLGCQDGRTVGHNHHAGNEAYVFRDTCQIGQQGELFEVFATLTGGEFAANRVGIRRIDAVGHEDVVTCNHAIESQPVSSLGYLGQRTRLRVGAMIWEVKPELHCVTPGWALAQKPTLKSPNNRVRIIDAIIKPATIPRTQPHPLVNDWKKLVMAGGQAGATAQRRGIMAQSPALL